MRKKVDIKDVQCLQKYSLFSEATKTLGFSVVCSPGKSSRRIFCDTIQHRKPSLRHSQVKSARTDAIPNRKISDKNTLFGYRMQTYDEAFTRMSFKEDF
jgi:hypothetical protein